MGKQKIQQPNGIEFVSGAKTEKRKSSITRKKMGTKRLSEHSSERKGGGQAIRLYSIREKEWFVPRPEHLHKNRKGGNMRVIVGRMKGGGKQKG